MELIACTEGEWQQAADGAAICTGTLQNVDGVPLTLPPLTYADATLILGLAGAAFAVAATFKWLRRFIFPDFD
ncbi:MAG: hypothetical protein ABGX87_10345 [Alcanivorax sp.]